MGQDALTPAQSHTRRQDVQHRELHDARSHWEVLLGILRNAQPDAEVTCLRQRGTLCRQRHHDHPDRAGDRRISAAAADGEDSPDDPEGGGGIEESDDPAVAAADDAQSRGLLLKNISQI